MLSTISTNTIEAIISRNEIKELIRTDKLDKEKLVLITIGEPDNKSTSKLTLEETRGFKDILMVEFWDIEEDFNQYKIITDEQGKIIQDFILKNIDDKFIINCQAGKSRSAAVGKAIECLKFFGIGDEAKYNYKTSFNSEIDTHSRYCPNLTVFDKIVKDYR